MALTTLGGLKAAIATWLERTGDSAVTGNVGDLVALAEARLMQELGSIRTTKSSTTLTGTVGSRALTLPAGYLFPVSLILTTTTDEQLLRAYIAGQEPLRTTQGAPEAWAVNDGALELDCLCDAAHTFRFTYAKGLGLTGDSDTNWLLTTYPNAYLFASIIEAATLLGDADTVAGYEARLAPVLAGISVNEAQNVRQGTAQIDAALAAGRGYDIYTDR